MRGSQAYSSSIYARGPFLRGRNTITPGWPAVPSGAFITMLHYLLADVPRYALRRLDALHAVSEHSYNAPVRGLCCPTTPNGGATAVHDCFASGERLPL